MEFLFDTANLEAIRIYAGIFPMTGVTSNPSILKAEGKIDFFAHMRGIREIIGLDRSLHVQVIAEDSEGIQKEADSILKNIDDKVYIKIPTTEEGLKAMRALKERGICVTATAIYTKMQGFMAVLAGADCLAPYFNRMENMDIDASETIAALRYMIDENGAKTKIIAASFKNIAQVNSAFASGAHAVTVPPSLLHDAFGMAAIQKAVDDFHSDWVATQGQVLIHELK